MGIVSDQRLQLLKDAGIVGPDVVRDSDEVVIRDILREVRLPEIPSHGLA